MKRLLFQALSCSGVIIVVLFVGSLLHEHFSWPQLRVNLVAFYGAITSGDAGRTIEALMSGKVVLTYLAVCLAIGLVWDSLRRRRSDRVRSGARYSERSARKHTP